MADTPKDMTWVLARFGNPDEVYRQARTYATTRRWPEEGVVALVTAMVIVMDDMANELNRYRGAELRAASLEEESE